MISNTKIYFRRSFKTGFLSFFLLFSLFFYASAQFYEYGQDAGSLRWNQFKTTHYKVIYPRGIDSVATAFANKLEYFYPHQAMVLDHNHSKMPVIIHNESSFSNGVFVWAPKRLEIFTNPDPNSYAEDWLSQLALHEGRHAFQIDKLNQGFTKALSYLGGEQAAGAMAAFLPLWYLEGDAVDAETRFSRSGRGRQPEFEMEMKAQLLEEGKVYSYSKATMGSYKDYIPNHYKLGYLMVRYGRIMRGDKLWIDFQQNAARKPFLITPTYFSMRKNGMGSKKKLYKQALDFYASHWDSLGTWRLVNNFDQWNDVPKKYHTNYNFPHFISPSLLIASKSGIDQIPEFILLGKNGDEKRIHQPGFLNSGRISVSGGLLAWDEFIPDTRWSNRNYSVIKTMAIGSGQVKSLGKKSRYYAPSISKGGSAIAAIEQDKMYKFSLVVLDLEGKVLYKIPSPDNYFIQHPTWMEEDSSVVVTLTNDKGKFLYAYSLPDRSWTQLYNAGFENISFPVVNGDRIFFNGTFSGIDNIYCLVLSENQVYQVSSSKFGGFQPQISADGSALVLSDYTAKGFTVKSIDLQPETWKPLESVRDHTEQIQYDLTAEEEKIVEEENKGEQKQYTSKPYRKFLHPFKFHSWLPLYFDYLDPNLTLSVEDPPASLGLSLLSQNHLSTVVSQFGYEYKDGFHFLHAGIQMKGRYPVFNISTRYGGLPAVLNPLENDTLDLKPNNLLLNAQVYIPFRLNTGKFISFIQPRIDYTYRADYQYYKDKEEYVPGAHYLLYDLYITSYLRQGKLDILPRIGFSSSINYSHSPFDHQLYGSEVSGRFIGYIPGAFKHQTIKLGVSYYKQYPLTPTRPNFRYMISPPRGMKYVYGLILSKYSVDYVFPILYPDLNLEGFFYLKRIRGALWMDHMSGKDVIVMDPNPHYEDKNYTTYGLDLLADLNLFRLAFPITAGGRVAYVPETESFVFEMIYSVDIN